MLYNKTEKIICQVFFLKISKILILTYFIKNDIIINKVFHDKHHSSNNKEKIFFMVLYLILFLVSYLWLAILSIYAFDVLNKNFIKFIFFNFICSTLLFVNIKTYNFLEIIFMLHIIILLIIVSCKIDKIEI